MINERRTIGQIKTVYGEIYDLERKRLEINKKIILRKKNLNAILNYIRMEGKGDKDMADAIEGSQDATC
jgi:hypothetical protein